MHNALKHPARQSIFLIEKQKLKAETLQLGLNQFQMIVKLPFIVDNLKWSLGEDNCLNELNDTSVFIISITFVPKKVSWKHILMKLCWHEIREATPRTSAEVNLRVVTLHDCVIAAS